MHRIQVRKKIFELVLVLVGILAIFFGGLSSQTKSPPRRVNFSGEWVFDHGRSRDRARSEFEKTVQKEYEKRGLKRKHSRVLTIIHNDPEIVITEKTISNFYDKEGTFVERQEYVLESNTLYTDERLEESMSRIGAKEATRTRWAGESIISERRSQAERYLTTVGSWGRSKPSTEVTFR